MGLPLKKPYISPTEYLEIQRTAELPSEYMDGEMIAMSGVGKAHGQITVALTRLVDTALLGKPCEASSGISVEAPASYLIPDLVIFCDGGEFGDDQENLRNPVVIFEILSPSTMSFDRGRKWMRYQQIASLMHYVLISQDEPAVEVYARENGDKWQYQLVTGLEGVVHLQYVDITFALVDIYQRVEFPAKSEE